MQLRLMKMLLISVSVLTVTLLTACGGGGSEDSSTSTSVSLSGGGVKGPLANAKVSVYEVDTTTTNFQTTEILAEATTDEAARITGLNIPASAKPPFILVFTAVTGTTDITNDAFPVVTTLRTIVTQMMFDENAPIYATPLTTIAVDMAIANADKNDGIYSGDGNGTASVSEFTQALTIAATQVESSLGFGLADSIDIFTTPPLITDTSEGVAEQRDIAGYRTAVEALTAILVLLKEKAVAENPNTTVTTDGLLMALANDLSDGEIDGKKDGEVLIELGEVANDVATFIVTDPATLKIPGTDIFVTDVETVLVSETIATATTTAVTALNDGTINITPTPAKTMPDVDGDAIKDSVDNCPLASNTDQLDTDNDGRGNVCDSDDDGDTIADGVDNCPLASNTDQLDTDNDGRGNVCDSDDDGDTIADGVDNCPLTSNTDQLDTDNDDQGNVCDSDDDGDTIADGVDNCPLASNTNQLDTDNDGQGNVCDSDDDGDTIADGVDNCPLTSNTDQADTDGDGIGNACDADAVDAVWDQIKWNEANWQ